MFPWLFVWAPQYNPRFYYPHFYWWIDSSHEALLQTSLNMRLAAEEQQKAATALHTTAMKLTEVTNQMNELKALQKTD